MDVHSVRIQQADIDRVKAELDPAVATAVALPTLGDACTIYKTARPILMIAVTVLQVVYKPGAEAITAAVAILDAACQ